MLSLIWRWLCVIESRVLCITPNYPDALYSPLLTRLVICDVRCPYAPGRVPFTSHRAVQTYSKVQSTASMFSLLFSQRLAFSQAFHLQFLSRSSSVDVPHIFRHRLEMAARIKGVADEDLIIDATF